MPRTRADRAIEPAAAEAACPDTVRQFGNNRSFDDDKKVRARAIAHVQHLMKVTTVEGMSDSNPYEDEPRRDYFFEELRQSPEAAAERALKMWPEDPAVDGREARSLALLTLMLMDHRGLLGEPSGEDEWTLVVEARRHYALWSSVCHDNDQDGYLPHHEIANNNIDEKNWNLLFSEQCLGLNDYCCYNDYGPDWYRGRHISEWPPDSPPPEPSPELPSMGDTTVTLLDLEADEAPAASPAPAPQPSVPAMADMRALVKRLMVSRGQRAAATAATASERLKQKSAHPALQKVSEPLQQEMLTYARTDFDADTSVGTITWNEVHGAEKAKEVTDEFFDSIRNPVNWGDGLNPKCCLLLAGPPGTGKTSVVKAAANEGKALSPEVLIFAPEAAALDHRDATKHAAKLTALFAVARACAPSIIFIDECDDLLSKHGGKIIGHLKTTIQDMANSSDKVLFIGATNHPDKIDGAILSRLGGVVELPLPDGDTRRRIIETALRGNEFSLQEEDWHEIEARTDGRDGRWLAHPSMGTLVRGVLKAVRKAKPKRAVTFADFKAVLDKAVLDDPAAAAAAAPAPASNGKRKADAATKPPRTADAAATKQPRLTTKAADDEASSSAAAAPAAARADANTAAASSSRAAAAEPPRAVPDVDAELCAELQAVLERLFTPDPASKVTRKRVYEVLESDGSAAWRKVPTREAAARGKHAPKAHALLEGALKNPPLCATVYHEGGSGSARRPEWFVKGIAIRKPAA